MKELGLLWRQEKSKDRAKERLQVILVQDRFDLSPTELEQIKNDIYKVLSKYVHVNEEDMEMNFKRRKRNMALVASIPLQKK